MSCEKYQEMIIESFGTGKLPDEITEHLKECDECQNLIAELREVANLAGNDYDFELSEKQRALSLDAIEQKIDELEFVKSKSNIWRIYIPAAAAVFLLVAVSLMTSWLSDPAADLDKTTDTLIASVEKPLSIEITGEAWKALFENSDDMAEYYDGMTDADLSEEEFQYLSDNFNVGELL